MKEDLEFYSVMRSVRAIEHCDVCLVVCDAQRGFDGQVQNIFWLAQRNHKGVVILVNKWDLIEKDTKTTKAFETHIRQQIEPLQMCLLFLYQRSLSNVFLKLWKRLLRFIITEQSALKQVY